VTPNAIADVLEWMYSLPNGSLYRSFLPVAGESGTLANRSVCPSSVTSLSQFLATAIDFFFFHSNAVSWALLLKVSCTPRPEP
jgi:hypothetical protein